MMSASKYTRKNPPSQQQLREIEVLIIAAEDLKNVKHVMKMKAYAEVYVEKEVHVARTRVDEHGETNPRWNETVKVRFHDKLLQENNAMAALNVDIYTHGHLREKPVGSARLLLCDLLKGGDAKEPLDNPIQCLTVQIWRPSGRPQGFLSLWVPPTGKFLIRRESLSFNSSAGETENQEKKINGDGETDIVVAEEKRKVVAVAEASGGSRGRGDV